jgi:hypothetical protein
MKPIREGSAMRLRFFLAVPLILILTAASFAQYRNEQPGGDPTNVLRGQSSLGLNSFRGLLDPSRMHMSHSIEFGMATVGGRSLSQGLYMNRIDYQISKPLSITTNLGYRFTPSGPAEWNPGVKNGDIVGGANLNWQPTPNMLFRIAAYRGYDPNPYYGYGWNRWEPYHYDRSYLDRR